MKIPKLRFPEFSGEWELKRLENLFFEFKSGEGITSTHIFEKGQYPVFGGNGLRGYCNTYTHEGEYFLIGRQGALCGNINRTKGKVYISEHAIACKANNSSDTEWLAQRLDFLNLNRLSESSAQPGLAVNKLLRLKLVVPIQKEQHKIASFLTLIDNKLKQMIFKKSLLGKYKNGIMQKLFSQELRLTDDDGNDFSEWVVITLGEISKRVTRKNKENNLNVLTISAQNGLINQEEYFNKLVSSKDVTGYYLMLKDDFAYNKSYSAGYPMGAIKRLKRYEKGVVSTLYICFRFSNTVDFTFMEQYFESGLHNREIEKVAQEGARNHGLLNIGVGDFFNTNIILPSLPEQQKIASFLSVIDDKIAQTALQIEKMQTWKKGILQQMFV